LNSPASGSCSWAPGGAAIAVAFGGAGIRELNIANQSVEHAVELQNKLREVGMEWVWRRS
jgi:shikimate 5-dehydrogenase